MTREMPVPPRTPKVLACLLALASLAACTTMTAGSARPVSGGSTVEDTSGQPPGTDDEKVPYAGAPNVNNPLEISRFVDDPCLALTAAQATQLQLPSAGKPNESPLGKACSWVDPNTFLSVDVSMLSADRKGLSSFYQASKDGKYDFFDPQPPIEGYPVVAYDMLDSRASGSCPVAVGVANDLAFEVAMQLGEDDVGQKDPCEEAAAAAALILQTMKAG